MARKVHLSSHKQSMLDPYGWGKFGDWMTPVSPHISLASQNPQDIFFANAATVSSSRFLKAGGSSCSTNFSPKTAAEQSKLSKMLRI